MGLLRAAKARLPPGVTLEILDIDLPLYNGDVEAKGVPAKVSALRESVKAADAVLFATPEYNYSVTAALKNALDWCSRTPNVFNDKPAAVIGAGGGAGTALSQAHLRQICIYLNVHFVNSPGVAVNAFAPGNFDAATGDLKNEDTKTRVGDLVTALAAWTRRLRHH
jgi:chromate reductase